MHDIISSIEDALDQTVSKVDNAKASGNTHKHNALAKLENILRDAYRQAQHIAQDYSLQIAE